MKILLCNDDGVDSPGLAALKETLSLIGRVVIVAPDRERSASSHALTINRPLRVKQVREDVYSVDGTPADCVHLALNGLLRNESLAFVVSGINMGGNLADDTIYSGTVAAAREAAMLGVPSFAISIVGTSDFHFDGAAAFAAKLAAWLLKNPLPQRMFLNVNVPNVDAAHLPECRFTRLGIRVYNNEIVEKFDPRGQSYYWIGGREPGYTAVADSDLEAIADGFVSVTPLGLDQTAHAFLERQKKDGNPL